MHQSIISIKYHAPSSTRVSQFDGLWLYAAVDLQSQKGVTISTYLEAVTLEESRDCSTEVDSQNYLRFSTILVFLQVNVPPTKKSISTDIKARVLFSVPNPIIAVRIESMMNAQNKAPPLRMPVIWAQPIGKATSQPISQVAGTMGTTLKPMRATTIMVRPAAGTRKSCRVSTTRSAHEVMEVKVIIFLQFLVFFMQIELIIAPIVPNIIKQTAAKDIAMSLYPNGFIRKLALAPNIKKVPQNKEYAPKNFHKLRSLLNMLNVYLMEMGYFLSIFEEGMVGLALMSMRFMMRMTRVANAYPRQRENIYLRAYQSSLCSLTTRVGMAKPIPDPITFEPTIMEVARALFAGKNQQVAILAGMFRMKGWPITKIRQPRTTQLKLALMKQERMIPAKQMQLPTMMPNLMPFLSRRQLAGMLTTRYPRKESILARLTTLLSTEYILTILLSRGMMILLSIPLRTIMMEANTRIIHRYLVQPYYPQQRVS